MTLTQELATFSNYSLQDQHRCKHIKLLMSDTSLTAFDHLTVRTFCSTFLVS